MNPYDAVTLIVIWLVAIVVIWWAWHKFGYHDD